ncbi:SPBc2 prophage-derived aminoglycoside N-acetyltransferase-like protein YokD [Aspergillus alliaceus]|uniref:SPBc2 prophage-derived aminoglycoside N-acetyltransferase-like protein YokD n=1 Tax=Petromyces alliaceus TaxID=209559 RepID=A0A5N7CN29_PETAA|nr:SPBc2 prophage-derived aminoglycoside N-acetyltransferase-like protein YokD [Aspergillus alliaceus]
MQVPVSGPLSTIESITRQLNALDEIRGTTILLHSSLSSLGWVCGGAEAVVLAILSAIGPDGTLVVPTHTGDNSDPAEWQCPPVPREWHAIIRAASPPYNPPTSRTRGMGVIAETIRTWPGAVRSAHPQTSFAAVGPLAEWLMKGHEVDCRLGESSPLAKLEKVDAKVLLLGVGFDVCTAFHLAEYRVANNAEEHMENNSFAIATEEGRQWITVTDIRISSDPFGDLGGDFQKAGLVIEGRVGNALVKLFKISEAVRYAEGWLQMQRK